MNEPRDIEAELIRRTSWQMQEIARLRNALKGASHALRSYQYGNASTELAEAQADAIDAILAPSKKKGKG